jgi:hypothetical protein
MIMEDFIGWFIGLLGGAVVVLVVLAALGVIDLPEGDPNAPCIVTPYGGPLQCGLYLPSQPHYQQPTPYRPPAPAYRTPRR